MFWVPKTRSRNFFEEPLPFLLRNTAADADDHIVALLFEFFPPAQDTVDLLFRLFPNAARIQQDHVGVADAVCLNVAATTHNLRDPFGIVLIHLAAVGVYEQFTHGTIRSTIL
jgi:hypothetical protein